MLMISDVTDNDLEQYQKLETSNAASVKKIRFYHLNSVMKLLK